ncbi:helix-turn-helix domain-containing protein [Thalassolituus pacificus]|uniref:AraC family transcriptional regulator n=1 Tax=Thalassolituus pacificus TaxID=2975440 RepID=A0A9X2WF51_9GAMM|nr:AraC family transcriptional regulator [Thalassolituus pacificus]MCT7358930.1 AraC family transcriptional regulator [Thalassolituus pacificus]
MNYEAGAAALIGLCLSSVLLLATLSWMVNHAHTRLTIAWLLGLATLVMLQSLEFLYHATDMFLRWPFFLKLVDPLVVLLPLTLYGYQRALQGDNIFHPRRQMLLHLSPAFIVALMDVPYWNLPAAERIDWMLKVRIDESLWQPLAPYGNDYLAIIAGLSLLYWWRQRTLGYQGRKARLGSWINKLQTVQLIIALSLLGRILLSTGFGWNLSVAFALAPTSAYLLYLMLSHVQLPQSHPPRQPLAMSPKPGSTDPASSNATPADASAAAANNAQQELFAELQQALANGAFRDNELSLGKLAGICGMTSHQASAAINQCSGSNFYDWLNQHRIEAAKQALRDSDTPVSRICFDVGFNSKSTFNTAFRRFSGCTPTEYRRRNQG